MTYKYNIMTTTTQLYQTGTIPMKIKKNTDILEKDIQTIIEGNMETYLGIRFVATEYSTGKLHGGRIDSLGIDENNVPVIIEYKRSMDSGAAIQGLFYLAWLMDHKSEFELEILKKFGVEISQNIDWSQPRVLCIANDFKKYVVGAINYMGPNIELMQYQLFDNGMLMLTDVYTKNQKRIVTLSVNKSVRYHNNDCDINITDIYKNLEEFLLELDDTVKMVKAKSYNAFRTNRNFAIVKIQKKAVKIGIPTINPNSIELEAGFTRDMSKIKGNDGDLDITLHTLDDLKKAKPILIKSFNNS